MKKTFLTIGVAVLGLATVTLTGCANVGKKSATSREYQFPGMVSPQGAFTPHLTWHPAATGSGVEYDLSYDFHPGANTNSPGLLDDLLKFRSVPLIDLTWSDTTKGGAITLLADPKASQISSTVNNQSDLGGNHMFNVGDVSWVTSTNAAQVITAGGSAVGSVIGQIVNKGVTGGAAP